jgi:predicted dinucleotide-binding enzyme
MAHDIAVVGAGNVGRALAGAWRQAGHRVTLGLRSPGGEAAARAAADTGATTSDALDAVAGAAVAVYAVPGAVLPDLLAEQATALDDTVVIDATNHLSGPGVPRSGLPTLAAVAPTAQGFRAFNSVGWENMAHPRFGDETADLFYAGPESDARAVVDGLIADVGFRPVYVGSGEQAHLAVDALATLWFALALDRGLGRHLALRMLHDGPGDAG